jgi:ATP synthase protein I
MPRDDFQKGVSLAGRVGLELAVSIVAGTFLGYGLDRWLSTGPWLMLAGLFLGAAAGFRNLYREMTRMDEPEDGKKEPDRTEPKDTNGKST